MKKSKAVVLTLFLLAWAGAVAGKPPVLEVSPGTVNMTGNNTVSANRDHNVTLTFTNKDSRRPIYNVTLPEKDYVSWSDQRFNLNISEARNITATIHTPVPASVNDRFTWNKTGDNERDPIQYFYNDTSGNESRITYNAEYFPPLHFRLETYRIQTEVDTAALSNQFNLSFNEKDQSVFQIDNTGRETAYNISFKAEDIEFQLDDGFNLSRGEDTVVSYTIELPRPEENATQATNRTYNRTITVRGDNFPAQEIELSVFVPYKDYGEDPKNESIDPILREFKEYCQTTGNCSRIREVVYKNRTVYKNKTFVNQANFSNATEAAIRQLADNELEDDKETRQRIDLMKHRFSNDIQSLNRSMRRMLRKAINESEQAQELAEEAKQTNEQEYREEKQQARNVQQQATYLLAALLVAGLLLAAGYVAVQIYQQSQDNRLIQQ